MKISNFKSSGRVSLDKYFEIVQENKQDIITFDLKIKKKIPLKNGESNGVYVLYFKKKLVYIGLHFGKGNVIDRWEKHIKSLTCRFLPLNFLSAEKDGNKFKKFYEKLTFNKLIDKFQKLENNSEKKSQIKDIIEKHIKEKKNELKNKYKQIYKPNNNIFKFLNAINIDSEKKIIQLLTNEGSNMTKNRLKFCLENWESFENASSENILKFFEATYIKYYGKKKFSKKIFIDTFEKTLIDKFNPPANSNYFKTKKTFVNLDDNLIINHLQLYLDKS